MKISRRSSRLALITTFVAASFTSQAAEAAKPSDAKQLDRGRYLVKIAGCNDCHTPGYAESGGNVPESQWLTGDRVGNKGPWGTTYPPNLRMFMQSLTEAQWLKAARTIEPRPPMPWYNLRAMADADLRAIYAIIRHLGPGGQPAPAYLPPGKDPSPPYWDLVLPK